MLPSIIFNKGQGGLGRPLTGQDYVSGLLIYTANLPGGFSSSSRVKCLFSPSDANALGILPDYNANNPIADSNYIDGTGAVGLLAVTAVGAVADVVTITCVVPARVTNPDGTASMGTKVVTLCTYTLVTGDHSDGTFVALATSLTAAINANTFLTGFSANNIVDADPTADISITAPKAYGIALNTGTPFAYTRTGTTFAGTLTQPTANSTPGIASLQAQWFYHIQEYFRLQPKGQLYLGLYAVPGGTYGFTEITSMQNYAQGIIRQIGIFLSSEAHAFAIGDITAINNEIVTNNDDQYQPLSALYTADMVATYSSTLATLPNLNNYSDNKVSIIIGQDGANQGAFLFATVGKSISCLGAALGAVSFASVSDDIGWIQKFNLDSGSELDVPAFANGQLLNATAQGYWAAVDNLRYVFILKYRGNSGTYFNDSHCATSISSDYAYIENNRTIDKADRGIYASVLPYLKGPLLLNADGTLADTTIAYLISLAGVNLAQMVTNSELSDYQVIIDSKQNVQSTGNLIMAVQLLGIGVARNITVNIGYVLSITGGQ